MTNHNNALYSPLKVDMSLAHTLLSNGVDGVSFCDLKNSNAITLDSKLSSHLGFDQNDSTKEINITWESFVHPEDYKSLNQHINSSIQNQDYKFNEEFKIFHNNGSVVWFRCIGFVVIDSTTSSNILITTYVDISKFKHTENKLQVKIDSFNHITEGARFGSWEHNIQTGEIIFNERWAGIIGYTLAEIAPINKYTWETYVHPDDLKKSSKLIDEHLEGKSEFYTCQIRMKHREGHWVWVFSSGKIATYTKDGKVEWFTGSHYDISNIKHNELELTHNKALLEQVNETAKIGAWELNLITKELHWSSTIKDIVELDEDFETTIENTNQFIYNEEDRELRVNYTTQAVITGEPFDHTLQLKTKTGKLKWAHYTGNIRYENNKPVAVYGFLQDIDKQMSSTLELAQQEEQFRKTFEFAHNGMCLVSLKGEFIKVNNSLCTMLGYSSQELESLTFQEITHVNFLKKDLTLVQDILNHKIESYQIEKNYIRKDGSLLWALLSVSLVKDSYGEPLHFISQINDITKRKDSELLLEHNTNLLESINEAAQIGIWEVDLNENTVYWSPVIKKLMGVPKDFKPNLEDAIKFFKEGENRDIITKAITTAIETGKNYDIDLEVVTANNQVKWARTIGISEFKNGKCVKLYGFFQDINEKKIAEHELARQEELFRKTFEFAHNGVALVDLDGKWTKVNQSVCDILGYSKEELYQSSFQDITHPEDLKTDNVLGDELLSNKRDRYQIEKRYFHKNGNIIWALLSVSLVRDDKGNPHHYISQIHDVTQRKNAEKHAESLYEITQERNEQLTNFAHIVSHNIRSHTGNLSMLFDLMEMEKSEASRNEILPLVGDAVNNLHETIGYLNEVIMLSDDQINQQLKPLQLNTFIEKAIVDVKSLLLEAKCEINNTVDNTISVLGLPAYMDSIILNFLTNAIKYKSPKRQPKINISTENIGDYVVLNFSDNGLGIDLKAHGKKLFGMYKTFHNHPDSRGIGLFLSKNQIEAMGGKIEVESKVDYGTTFKIYFKL